MGGHRMGGDLEELDTIYQYDPIKEQWSLLGKRLRRKRTSFVAISLPDYLSCSNNFKPPEKKYRGLHHRQREQQEEQQNHNRFYGSFFN